MSRRLLATALSLALVGSTAACSNAPPKYPYEKEPDPRSIEYVIGIADELDIRVWKNGELSTGVIVRPDGTITMPLIGDVKAVGLTPTQLKADITAKLGDFLKAEETIVTIAVTGVNSYSFTVAGNVGRPGRIESTTYLTVADAIALAGGPNRFASPDKTVVLRLNPDGTTRRIPVNYDQVKEGEHLQQNIVLLRGDNVFMP